jgi:hypothetical protein
VGYGLTHAQDKGLVSLTNAYRFALHDFLIHVMQDLELVYRLEENLLRIVGELLSPSMVR